MTGPWEAPFGCIRIIQRPEGEAPEWVRDAWIGLELPVQTPEPVSTPTWGALTGPRSRWSYRLGRLLGRFPNKTGYVVDAAQAVRLLERRNPTAAIWWRTKAGIRLQPAQAFLFETAACEKVG